METVDLLMVVGADLTGVGKDATIGPEQMRVCKKTVETYRAAMQCGSLTMIISTAGWSVRHQVSMNDTIRTALLTLGVPDQAIVPPNTARALTFNTDGEMIALCTFIGKLAIQHPYALIRIHVVCRWWHMDRALRTLEYHLKNVAIWQKVEIYDCRAQSRAGWLNRIIEDFRRLMTRIRTPPLSE